MILGFEFQLKCNNIQNQCIITYWCSSVSLTKSGYFSHFGVASQVTETIWDEWKDHVVWTGICCVVWYGKNLYESASCFYKYTLAMVRVLAYCLKPQRAITHITILFLSSFLFHITCNLFHWSSLPSKATKTTIFVSYTAGKRNQLFSVKSTPESFCLKKSWRECETQSHSLKSKTKRVLILGPLCQSSY